MRVGFAALARPTFDVALAETVSAAAWGRLDDLGHDLLGTPGLILEEGDLAGAVADLAREPLEALVVMQATFADASPPCCCGPHPRPAAVGGFGSTGSAASIWPAIGCEAAVTAEARAVTKLEGRGVSSVVARRSGKRDDRLDRERAELARAELSWQAQVEHVATLDRDRARTESERFALQDAQEQLDRRRAELVESCATDGSAPELVDAVLAASDRREQARELTEARRAGRQALRRLAITQERLDRAAAGSAGDVLGGGSMISAFKLNQMDQAHEGLVASREALVVYERELADVEELELAVVDLTPSFGLLDLCLEGLIGLLVDLRADERIRQARKAVTDLRATVAAQIEQIDLGRKVLRSELAAVETQEEALLAHHRST